MSCAAFFAGRYLARHGYDRAGLTVSAGYDFADGRPSRVGSVTISVKVPAELPESRRPALAAMARHCMVHNTLHDPPQVQIDLA